MPSLKEYRNRISSVKATRKITSAMKMVAASKLKRAQDQAESSQPYARAMAGMMARVAKGVIVSAASPKLLIGTGKDQTHLLVVVTSDRGLCGGFNGNLVRAARAEIRRLEGEGKTVKILTVGRKARDLLRRDHAAKIVKSITGIGASKRIQFSESAQVSDFVLEQFEAGGFDICSLIYNEFKSVLTQKPSVQQLIPFKLDEAQQDVTTASSSPYEFEPEEEQMLAALLPRNIAVQIFRALLDSAAGEQAARMTAMDSATRNAGDMIKRVTIQYNRARQAYITKELIEIISGAEAV